MAKSEKLTILERISLELLWGFCWFIAIMPHFVQFRIISPVVRFVTYHLLHYRRTVVDHNLLLCFPELSQRERNAIRSDFYTYLCETIVSTLALARSSSMSSMFPRHEYPKPESKSYGQPLSVSDVRAHFQSESVVVLTAHFGLWEYMLFMSLYVDRALLAVYHPLKNRVFDELFKRLRNHGKVLPLPAKEMIRFTVRHGKQYNNESYFMGLIADQNPPRLPNSYWHEFFGHQTIFFDGGEKLAKRIGLPVYFAYQCRVEPGRYELLLLPIWDGKEEIADGEITHRYVEFLESVIRENPSLWLWSHRRFKSIKR